jgi:regulator of sigma E protease
MEGLIMAAQLLLALSILVILHEAGHYAAARAFGIKVEKFYLFFDAWGFKLLSFTIKDTEYGIGWLPLGGYVKIAGMVDESMDTEAMKQPPQPWEFRSKPAWQRLIVMLGGVIVNAIVGILIFSLMTFYYGEKYIPIEEVKYGIHALKFAQEIGLKSGDKIIAINGKKVSRFDEVRSPDVILKENTVFTVERDGQVIDVPFPSNFLNRFTDDGGENYLDTRLLMKVDKVIDTGSAFRAGIKPGDLLLTVDGDSVIFFDQLIDVLQKKRGTVVNMSLLRGKDTLTKQVAVNDSGMINVGPDFKQIKYNTDHYSFFQSFPVGINKGVNVFKDQVKSWGKIFSGKIKFQNAVQGPIAMAGFYGGEWKWERFWALTGLISLVLAFMNLLPIPALDGGHVVFLLIEMLRGKPLGDKFMEKAQVVGMVLLFGLMIFAFTNDIWRKIEKYF